MPKSTDIPVAARRAVWDRDKGHCRVCGRYANSPEIHHIVFRSQDRNNHGLGNLVMLDYEHHRLAHTRSEMMREALLAVLDQPSMTALRWLRRRGVDLRTLRGGTL